MATPDIRPVGNLPDEIGKTAARELSLKRMKRSDVSIVARRAR